MKTTTYAGIDYSLGRSNIDSKTGIHYGVISQHSIMPEAAEDFEYDYGNPTCPKCGHEIKSSDNYKRADKDFYCPKCRVSYWSDSVYSEQPLGWSYDRNGYGLRDCLDNDIFVLVSPYYTFAQFCSPCVPGAGNLDNPCESGPKTFCLGHDWFEGGKAPYPVYSVETGKQIVAVDTTEVCPNCSGTGRDTLERVAKARECSTESLIQDEDFMRGISDFNLVKLDFQCWRCSGKGSLPVVNYEEKE